MGSLYVVNVNVHVPRGSVNMQPIHFPSSLNTPCASSVNKNLRL